jgi:multisubunit Na+/H+ antiporter MnhB subunit
VTEAVLDIALAAAVVAIGWRCLTESELFTASVAFIAFGLALALAWARLGASDVALAEAALGAGITGVLLVDAARELGRTAPGVNAGADAAGDEPPASAAASPDGRPGTTRRVVAAAMAGILGLMLTWAVLDLPSVDGPLAEPVRAGAADAGASNPVTAVLLAFRAYDTWLEVVVVLAAVVGVLAVARARDVTARRPPPAEPVLSWMTGIVAPLTILGGGFLLWLGTTAPGGAFQGGAVLGAGALLLWLAGRRSVAALPAPAMAALLTAGAAAFLALGALPLIAGEAMLDIPEAVATELIIAVEAAVTVSVAVSLAVLVIATRAGDTAGDEGS